MKTNRLLFKWLALGVCVTTLSLGHFCNPPKVTAANAGDDWVNMSGADAMTKYWFTEGNWTFADGVFTLTPRPGEKGWQRWKHYLWSKKLNYGDFEIKFDYKGGKGTNSGFFFRVDENKMFVDGAKYGLEVQIFDSAGMTKLSDHTSGGLIPGVLPLKNAAKPMSEWNAMHIINSGDKLTVFLNDEKVHDQVDLTKGVLGQRPKTGPIGFQDEALPVMVRNVRLKEL
jgi:Domain of Unknown Function (DUF1080)